MVEATGPPVHSRSDLISGQPLPRCDEGCAALNGSDVAYWNYFWFCFDVLSTGNDSRRAVLLPAALAPPVIPAPISIAIPGLRAATREKTGPATTNSMKMIHATNLSSIAARRTQPASEQPLLGIGRVQSLPLPLG